MKWEWRYELPQWAMLVAMFVAAALCWPRVPERMPVHWNLAGEVDGYGGRFAGLLLVPLLALGFYAMMLVLPRIDPGRANYPGFWPAYTVFRGVLLVFMAVVYAAMLLTALGFPVSMSRVISWAMGLMLIIMGNYMGKIRPNWFVGVRTPWTLSSKLAWTKTHRLAGWLFVVAGVIFLLHGWFHASWLMVANLIYGVAALLWLAVYSYLQWRSDPDRTPPAGTWPVA